MCKPLLIKKALAWAFVAISCVSLGMGTAAYAEDEPMVSLEDFYFFNKDGKKTPLALAMKVILRFTTPQTDEELAVFWSNLGSIEQQRLSSSDIFEVSFLPTEDPDTLLWKMKEVFRSGKADIAPVFIVFGREAIIDGVVITPSTVVSVPFMEKSLKRIFGNISFHQFTARGKGWHVAFSDLFFLKNAKDPLHALSFGNILRTSREAPWVKAVSPSFRFLGDAFTAKIAVSPLTGTIGEERTVSLTLTLLNSADSEKIRVEESLLPDFGEGDFVPKFGTTPPPSSFFKVTGGNARREEKEAFGKTITYSWRFVLYAPESEWAIPGQKITYLLGEEPREAESVRATFFTLSHVKAALQDMPLARSFPRNVARTALSSQERPLSLPPSHFLDSLVRVSGGEAQAKIFGAIMFAAVLLSLGIFFVREMARADVSATPSETLWDDARILAACRNAGSFEGSAAYGAFARIVAGLLHSVVPELPKEEFSLEQVKRCMEEHARVRALFSGEPFSLMQELAGILNSQYALDASLSADEKEKIEGIIMRLKETLAARMMEHAQEQEGETHAGT